VRREGMMMTRATASLAESGDHFATTTSFSVGTATWSVHDRGSLDAGIESQAWSLGDRPFEASLAREDTGDAGEAQAIEARAITTATHATRYVNPLLMPSERAPRRRVVAARRPSSCGDP
jgi:hypothetical protein